MKTLFLKLTALLLCFALTFGVIATTFAAQDVGTGNTLDSPTYTTITTGEDWGPAISKIVLKPSAKLAEDSISADKFTAVSVRTFPDVDYQTYEMSAPVPHEAPRTITAAYLSDEGGNKAPDGDYITLEMEIGPDLAESSPFWFNLLLFANDYAETSYIVTNIAPLTTVDGQEVTFAATDAAGYVGNVNLLADEFDTTGQYEFTYDGGDRKIDLAYASWFPTESTETGSVPLIIWLHGGGEGGSNPYLALLGNKVTALIDEEVQQEFGDMGAAVLVPQSPTMWLDTNGARSMAMGTPNSESFYTEALMSLITDFVQAHPSIDTTRLYLGGCSNGGYMTIRLLLDYPDVFAAAYPICEPYDDAWLSDADIEMLAKVPMWLTAAKTDSVVVIYEGKADEAPPFLYRVTTDEAGNEIPLPTYANALYARLTEAKAEDVHYSLFDTVVDTSGLYKDAAGEPYEYNGHWSWLYALNNECIENIDGKETTIFAWMAEKRGLGALPTLPLEKKVYPAVSFYLIRHGQTEYNVEGLAQGWSDSPLTEKGVALAKQLGEGLAEIPFVAAYSSTSNRAVDTAKLALGERDVPFITDENLREMYFGTMEEKPAKEMYTEENIGYRFTVGFDDLGGETWEILGGRMASVLDAAALAHRETGGNILISTHGMSIVATLHALTPDAPGVAEQGEIENCSVTLLEWDNGIYTLKTLNDTSFIE